MAGKLNFYDGKMKQNPKTTKRPNGFTLIELLITIAVIGLGVSAALVALQQSIGVIDYAKSRLTAIFLAQEGVEIVKNIVDTNFLESHYSPPATWRENLGTGDFELQYTDPQTVDPSLVPLPCSPNCVATSSSLRFLKKQNNDLYSYNMGDPTKYKRKVNIQINGEEITVNSIVYWKKRQGEFGQVELVQKLYKWW